MGQWGGLGKGRLGPPPYRKQCAGRPARPCKGDHRARTAGSLGALAGAASWCLTPAAAPAAGGPPSPALPRWPTGSPAPGPRREDRGSYRDCMPAWRSVPSARQAVPLAGCVALDMWVCLSEPQGPLCTTVTGMPPYRAALRSTVHRMWGSGP